MNYIQLASGKLTQLWEITIFNGEIHYFYGHFPQLCQFTRRYIISDIMLQVTHYFYYGISILAEMQNHGIYGQQILGDGVMLLGVLMINDWMEWGTLFSNEVIVTDHWNLKFCNNNILRRDCNHTQQPHTTNTRNNQLSANILAPVENFIFVNNQLYLAILASVDVW